MNEESPEYPTISTLSFAAKKALHEGGYTNVQSVTSGRVYDAVCRAATKEGVELPRNILTGVCEARAHPGKKTIIDIAFRKGEAVPRMSGSHSSGGIVIISERAVELLDDAEMEAVLRHELRHTHQKKAGAASVISDTISNIAYAPVIQALYGICLMSSMVHDRSYANSIMFSVGATLVNTVIGQAISRWRENDADNLSNVQPDEAKAFSQALEKMSEEHKYIKNPIGKILKSLGFAKSVRALVEDLILESHPKDSHRTKIMAERAEINHQQTQHTPSK